MRDSSIFGDIYGFPERLLSFISQVTALANELAVYCGGDADSIPSHLVRTSKTLERSICTWEYADDVMLGIDGSLPQANQTIITHLVIAIHSAILIFYYRRVVGIHPLVLQSLVEKVIDELEQHEYEKAALFISNTGIVWPGFIAIVEALDNQLQQRLYSWLRNCARTTGMRNFDVAADFALELWEYRRQVNDPTISWLQLVRDRRHALVLT